MYTHVQECMYVRLYVCMHGFMCSRVGEYPYGDQRKLHEFVFSFYNVCYGD